MDAWEVAGAAGLLSRHAPCLGLGSWQWIAGACWPVSLLAGLYVSRWLLCSLDRGFVSHITLYFLKPFPEGSGQLLLLILGHIYHSAGSGFDGQLQCLGLLVDPLLSKGRCNVLLRFRILNLMVVPGVLGGSTTAVCAVLLCNLRLSFLWRRGRRQWVCLGRLHPSNIHSGHLFHDTRERTLLLGSSQDFERVPLGTDHKKGLMNAIDSVFPKAHQILCLRHINMNILAKHKGDFLGTGDEWSLMPARMSPSPGMLLAASGPDALGSMFVGVICKRGVVV